MQDVTSVPPVVLIYVPNGHDVIVNKSAEKVPVGAVVDTPA